MQHLHTSVQFQAKVNFYMYEFMVYRLRLLNVITIIVSKMTSHCMGTVQMREAGRYMYRYYYYCF